MAVRPLDIVMLNKDCPGVGTLRFSSQDKTFHALELNYEIFNNLWRLALGYV